MEKINEDFNIPIYIVDEIVDYIEQTAKGRCRCMKWQNIKALLRLVQVNNRLSEQQVEYIIKKYCREVERNDIIKFDNIQQKIKGGE